MEFQDDFKYFVLFTNVPSTSAFNKARLSVIQYFGWKRVAILREYDDKLFTEVLFLLRHWLERRNPHPHPHPHPLCYSQTRRCFYPEYCNVEIRLTNCNISYLLTDRSDQVETGPCELAITSQCASSCKIQLQNKI